MDKVHHYWRRTRQFIELIVRQYQQKECQKSAASLTYVTLFAIVPLMTVTFSMFSIIPAFEGVGEQLQTLIFSHALPYSEQELVSYLQEFSSQARKLTVIGVVFLVGSAYLMLKNIEANFNSIWGVKYGRRGIMSFLLYWAILSLGPLLLGVALAISTYVASLRLLMDEYASLGLVTWLFQFLPVLLSAAAFTLLFAAVPNCKVPVSDAAIGGFVTAITFELLKRLFGLVVTNSSFTLIYGAFALVPLFLLWINMIWMVVLGGAVLVHTIGTYKVVLKDRGYPDLLATLLVLWKFRQASARGLSLSNPELLQIGLSSEQWRRIRDILQSRRLIAATSQGDFVLCYDLHQLSLAQLAGMLQLSRQLPPDVSGLEDLPWLPAAKAHLGAIDEFASERMSISVAALFENGGADVDGAGSTVTI
ncbi:MAG: YihY family inner membrane protein [Cellvibrio sp.]